jgi:hypothetical protein
MQFLEVVPNKALAQGRSQKKVIEALHIDHKEEHGLKANIADETNLEGGCRHL